jgi:AraC-like DNA-binding protein
VLAEAGLLDGKRASTHWFWCPKLETDYPAVQVDRDAIYVRDGKVWTSAGVTSGMDLALALVEDDLGHEAALQVARFSVMYMMRPGGQSQFSAHLVAQRAEDPAINATLDFILANPGDPLTVTALAARAGLSERTFARRFKDETGMTPAAYVETARVQAARVALETTAQRCRADRDRRGVPECRTDAPGLPAASGRFRLGIPRAVSRLAEAQARRRSGTAPASPPPPNTHTRHHARADRLCAQLPLFTGETHETRQPFTLAFCPSFSRLRQ